MAFWWPVGWGLLSVLCCFFRGDKPPPGLNTGRLVLSLSANIYDDHRFGQLLFKFRQRQPQKGTVKGNVVRILMRVDSPDQQFRCLFRKILVLPQKVYDILKCAGPVYHHRVVEILKSQMQHNGGIYRRMVPQMQGGWFPRCSM